MFLVENVPALPEVLGYESEVLTFGLRKWDFHIPWGFSFTGLCLRSFQLNDTYVSVKYQNPVRYV